MPCRMAIFDWNGTLLDDIDIVYKSVVEIFKRYDLNPPTLQELRNEISSDFIRFYQNHGMPLDIKGDDLNKIRKEIFKKFWHEAKLREGIFELLDFCKKLGMLRIIVSAEMPQVLENRIKQFSLHNHIDKIIGGAYNKEEVLFRLINEHKIMPNEMFYLDDSIDGIKAAKNLGIIIIGFTNGYISRDRIIEVNPDFEASSLSEVLNIINQ